MIVTKISFHPNMIAKLKLKNRSPMPSHFSFEIRICPPKNMVTIASAIMMLKNVLSCIINAFSMLKIPNVIR